MLKTVRGIYRDGVIELPDKPEDFAEEGEVQVTYMPDNEKTKRNPTSLRGIWKDAFSEDFDVEKSIREIRDGWKEELDKYDSAS